MKKILRFCIFINQTNQIVFSHIFIKPYNIKKIYLPSIKVVDRIILITKLKTSVSHYMLRRIEINLVDTTLAQKVHDAAELFFALPNYSLCESCRILEISSSSRNSVLEIIS